MGVQTIYGGNKMTPKEAELKYGKERLELMVKTGWLDGITVTSNTKGEIDVPASDYDRAYRASLGKKIHPMEWD